MPSKETGTQWSSTPRLFDPSPSESKDLSDKFPDFWHSLPRGQHLRHEALNRARVQKSQTYLRKALGDLVSISRQAERDEEEWQKQYQEAQARQRKLRILDDTRFKSEHYLDSKLDSTLENYLESMPRKWALERAEINKDLKKKMERRLVMNNLNARRPRIIRKIVNEKSSSDEFRMRLLQIQKDTKVTTASEDKKREIRLQMKEMNLFNRPTHFIKINLENPLDPIEGEPTIETMYEDVKQKISKEALDKLMNPEPVLTDYGVFKYQCKSDDPRTSTIPESLTNLDKVEEVNPNEYVDKELEIAAAEYQELNPDIEDQFTMVNFRDLVNILETESWSDEVKVKEKDLRPKTPIKVSFEDPESTTITSENSDEDEDENSAPK